MKQGVSIIVPVYNVERYLEECLNSILNQTFKNFEVILVNDGSTDCSGIICNEFSEKDSRIKVIHKKYGGVSSARNIGVSVAGGDYIGFVDSDDRIDKDMYKKLLELSIQTDSDIAICQLGREIEGKIINPIKEEFNKELNGLEAMRELFKGKLYRFSLCNKLFKKSCFEKVIFPEGRIHEDLSTTYKLFSQSKKSVYTNYIGYIYVKRTDSILTSRFNEKRMDAFLGWEEILKFMSEKYVGLTNEFISCFTYGCVDNIYYILNQVEETEQAKHYLNCIRRLVRKNYRKIILNESLSIKYKATITLMVLSSNLLIVHKNIKKNIKVGNVKDESKTKYHRSNL